MSKIQVRYLKYTISYIPLLLTLLGNLLGGYWTITGFLFVLLLIPLDYKIKYKNKFEIKDLKKTSNWILVGMIILQFLVFTTYLWSITSTNLYTNNTIENSIIGAFTGLIWLGFGILSNALSLGIAFSAAAHELIHRRNKILYNLGLASLFLAGYAYHPIEHIKGHHRYVGLPRDPSTPQINQSYYNFFIVGKYHEFLDALHFEAERFAKKGLPKYTWQNLAVRYTTLWLAFAILILFIGGIITFVAYILTVFLALAFHSAVVYCQHYGLTRSEKERVGDTLSWQTNSWITEYFLLGFGRHSDHHTRVTKTYTEIIDKEKGPMLPAGYFGTIPLILFPSRWKKITNKKIAKLGLSNK